MAATWGGWPIGFARGRLAPGPDYRLYLVPTFVDHKDAFLPVKARSRVIGDVKTFDVFILGILADIDAVTYTTALIWCEAPLGVHRRGAVSQSGKNSDDRKIHDPADRLGGHRATTANDRISDRAAARASFAILPPYGARARSIETPRPVWARSGHVPQRRGGKVSDRRRRRERPEP
ncbi:MAG: hypothetical protein AAF074_15235, partial [Pseudomonadota bacterium]